MKNLIIILMAFMPMLACVKPETTEIPADKWNGYSKYLKTGEMVHTLWAGQHINIGTVTYGLDDNANFYVTYNCTAPGWKIEETHLYAGDKAGLPLNRPGRPKIGCFPYQHEHHPKVTTYTYRIPLTSLPPCASPGFIVAAHAIVYHQGHYKCGQTETAWAEGNYTFSDKGWGWYDSYYYDPPQPPLPVLYATAFNNDTMKLFHLDLTFNSAELMMAEYIGNTPGFYDGAAFDPESGYFFFTKYNTGELWLNQLQGDEPSFCAGILDGPAKSGTFYDGSYFYVNANTNTINKVLFNDNWMKAGEMILDTVPGSVIVNDIAMSPAGDFLHILGHYDGSGTVLMRWNVETGAFFSTSVSLDQYAQIAFGSDGQLYATSALDDGNGGYEIYAIDMESAVLTPIEDVIIILPDPFSDLSGGPAQ
jgi:hypothetical protein